MAGKIRLNRENVADARYVAPAIRGGGAREKLPPMRVWDSLQRGFALSITPQGVKSFIVSYHVNGRPRRATIGQWPEWTPDKARVEAARILREASCGEDHLAKKEERRREEAEAMTLSELWKEYQEHKAPYWRPKTKAANEWLFTRLIAPSLGKHIAGRLTRRQVEMWHRSHQETPINGNRGLSLLRALLNYGIEAELLPGPNPASRVKAYREEGRERYLNADEVRLLFLAINKEEELGGVASVERGGDAEKGRRGGKGLTEIESRGISPHAAGLFRLLVYTGARLSEIKDCKWAWLDWERALIHLPESKTGKKTISLSAAALEELERLFELRTQNEWIIEGRLPDTCLVNAAKPWERVKDRAFKILNEERTKDGLSALEETENPFTSLRIHDLRHSWASFAVEGGAPLFTVGKALGHASTATTQRYSHLGDNPLRAVHEAVAARISAAVASKGARIEDVSIQRKVWKEAKA